MLSVNEDEDEDEDLGRRLRLGSGSGEVAICSVRNVMPVQQLDIKRVLAGGLTIKIQTLGCHFMRHRYLQSVSSRLTLHLYGCP